MKTKIVLSVLLAASLVGNVVLAQQRIRSAGEVSDSLVWSIGAVDAIVRSFPATNEDGTPNQAAQDVVIDAAIDSGVANGLIILSPGQTIDQVKAFARDMVVSLQQYLTSTGRQGLP